MARVTNPGAPQRVSAHVVPKAPSFSADDEDEKTTIESGGWEEEASTTVEQGEVADKIRALGIGAPLPARSNTSITSTDGGGVNDEPTVDDQRAVAALALLPPPSAARLVVTQGNDAGRMLEVRPGKTYSVGRGIDNDLVLTDITASRKHFEIRHDNGSWILADRASGNGTLINDRIEDAPFVLASGDRIEVGNTAFRFDLVTTAIALPGLPREAPAHDELPRGGRDGALARGGRSSLDDPSDSRELPTPAVLGGPVSRELVTPEVLHEAGAPSRAAADARDGRDPGESADDVQSFDGSVDDELELSTVSGKPLPGVDMAAPAASSRPKTLPPPGPRARTQTGRPAMAFAGPRSQQLAVPQAQQAIPPSALAAAMAPTISPMHAAPVLPQPATTLPLPQMAGRPPLSPALLEPHSAQPATLPGQGPPVPPGRSPRLPFSYPSAPELLPQRGSGLIRAPLPVAPGHPARDATSTAQVHPMSYSGGPAVMAQPPAHGMVPRLSRRTAMVALGVLGFAVCAAIATIAILRSAAGPLDAGGTVGTPRPASASTGEAASAAAAPQAPRVPANPTSPAAGSGGPRATRPANPPAAPAPAPAPANPAAGPANPPAGAARTAADRPAAPSAPSPAPSAETPSLRPAPGNPPPGSPSPAPTAPARAPGRETVATAGPPASAPSPGEPAATPARTPAADRTAPAPRQDVTPPARSERKPTRHVEAKKPERKPVEVAAAPSKPERKHGGRSLLEVKNEATGLYRSKNFSGAALAITSSLSGFSGEDARELKSLAAIYGQLGKAYAVGMAPGTKPTEAYQALVRAIPYDREVGAAYGAELQDKLAAIAPRAATSYMAGKSYEQALQAVRTAESLNSKSENLKIVRGMLEDTAKELLRAARSELSSDPESAKQKLRQVQGMVEPRNPLYIQAGKLLNGS